VSSTAAHFSSITQLADALNDALPQTQCTRCGYPDCRAYARAVASGEAGINQCPPGGSEGIARLATISGRPVSALNSIHGIEGPRAVVRIDEAWCIGCTLCIQACPVDCIVGAPKLMHTVIESQCTGCELCIPACPVDCIALMPVSGQRTGWSAWSAEQAAQARVRYEARGRRQAVHVPEPPAHDNTSADRKSWVIQAALARARAAKR
jgi:electron transport complex protein RnfB